MKIVELPSKDFEKLVKELQNCKKDKEKLKQAVNFLNDELEKLKEVLKN